MKKNILFWLLLTLMLPATAAWSQKTTKPAEAPNKGIFVSDNVVQLAKQLEFKYMDNLKKAENGDQDAFKELLQFHVMTDGVDGLNHAVTCLELINIANDENSALAIRLLKPKLKTLLLERYQLAQGRTQQEALRKPIADWAPMTWAALNNLPIPGLCDMTKETPMTKPGNKAAPKPANATTDNPAVAPRPNTATDERH